MKRLLTLFTLVLVALVLQAQNPQKLTVDPKVRYGKLENGMTYYIRHNAYPEKRADFYIAQKVGSMQEEDNQAGLAHFLEHMAFNGTKHYPGRKTMLNYLETIGAKFGMNVNAYTSFDETVYNLSDIPTTRSSIIDSCLLVLHDWSSFIELNNEEIDKERLIIKEEWRTRGNSGMRMLEKQLPVIFKGTKYADRLPIGKMEVVEHFPYQVLKDYYHKWYRPDLQAIIIVGDINVDEVEAKIKTMFADIPKPVNPAERIYYPVSDNDEPIVSVVTDPEAVYTIASLYIKNDGMPAEIKGTQMGLMVNFASKLISSMLGDRLNEIAQKADAPFTQTYTFSGDFFVSKTKKALTELALCKEGQIKEVVTTLIRENERVRQFGFTEAEVERAKASLLQRYEQSYNNREKEQNKNYVREYVRAFSDDEAIPGIEFEYNFIKQYAPMITAQAINEMAKQLIKDKNIVVTVTGPEKENIVYPSESEIATTIKEAQKEKVTVYEEKVSNEPLIAQLPARGKIVNTEADNKMGATVWTLSNGMRVVVKKTDFKDDEVRMSSLAYGGTSNFSEKDVYNASLASMVTNIGGIGNFSATDLKKALAGKSASVSPSISKWTQGFYGNSSKKDLETLLQLTYLHFTAPRKDEGAYTNVLQTIKTQLRNLSSEPSYIFQEATTKAMYGDNPYMQNMKLEDAEKLNYDRIIEIYKEVFANPGSFVFTFVGTVDETELKPLVEQYLASLPSGNKAATYKKIDTEINKGKINKIFEQEMKNPKTSAFELYSGTIKRTQKSEITLSALKQILDIVYVRTVREAEGGTYGVGVGARFNRIPDGQVILQMFFDTDPERVSKLSPIISREVESIAQNGPQDEDFQKVKEFMAKQFKQDEKTNGYWTSTLNYFHFYGEDGYSDYLSTVNALSKDDIKNFTKELISQGNFIEVIMNPKK